MEKYVKCISVWSGSEKDSIKDKIYKIEDENFKPFGTTVWRTLAAESTYFVSATEEEWNKQEELVIYGYNGYYNKYTNPVKIGSLNNDNPISYFIYEDHKLFHGCTSGTAPYRELTEDEIKWLEASIRVNGFLNKENALEFCEITSKLDKFLLV